MLAKCESAASTAKEPDFEVPLDALMERLETRVDHAGATNILRKTKSGRQVMLCWALSSVLHRRASDARR